MLRFLDSFDHYATAQITNKWSSNSGGVISVVGRNSTSGLRLTTSGDLTFLTLDAQATWIVGVAVYVDGTFGGVDNRFLSIRDDASIQMNLRFSTSGQLILERNGTQVGSTGATVHQQGVFYYIELAVTIANSGGTAVVHSNEVEEINFTGDTQATANATANRIYLESSNGVNFNFDDLYINDGTGGVNDDFLGDLRVESLFPNGNGNSSQWVGSDGNSTDNYLLVDETAPNDDTDYVQGSTVGDKDTYAFSNLSPGSGTVHGLQILPFARKTDAGARSIATVARHSATEEDGPDRSLSTTYTYLYDVRETKPGGGSWSVSDVNGAEFGVKVTV